MLIICPLGLRVRVTCYPHMPYKDKEKQLAAQRRYYAENKAKVFASQNSKRNKWRKYIQEVKESSPCMDCGIQYPHYVMDFDHVRGVKVGNISTGLGTFSSFEKLLEEIAKCEVVCANCHRHRTFMRKTKG